MAVQRPGGKSATAFRTISEVSQDLEVPQHVLRFWETKFPQVRPLKRGGGRRYYRPEDIELLRRIRDLLYGEGYTIKGVQRLLRDAGGKQGASQASSQGAPQTAAGEAAAATTAGPLSDEQRRTLRQVLSELTELRDLLRPGDK